MLAKIWYSLNFNRVKIWYALKFGSPPAETSPSSSNQVCGVQNLWWLKLFHSNIREMKRQCSVYKWVFITPVSSVLNFEFFVRKKPKNSDGRWTKTFKTKTKNANHYQNKRGEKKMHGGEIVFDYSCLPFWIFFPHSKLKKSQRK